MQLLKLLVNTSAKVIFIENSDMDEFLDLAVENMDQGILVAYINDVLGE